MAIKGVIYSNQAVSAAEHALLFRKFISDGILYGCGISYRFNTCTISSGAFVLAGRLTEIQGSEDVVVEGTSGYARIKGVIDLTQKAEKKIFQQFYFDVDYAQTADGFTALVQEDVNNNGQRYEVEWAVLTLSASGISSIVRSISESSGSGTGGGSDTPGTVTSTSFSYDGTYDFQSSVDHWELALLSSGTLKFSVNPGRIDIFVVGAGGNGGSAYEGAGLGYAGSGGNGGECVTSTGIAAAANNPYSITIGTNGHYTEGFDVRAYGGNDENWSNAKGKAGGVGSITSADSGSRNPGDGVAGEYAFGSSTSLYGSGVKYGASGGGGGSSHNYSDASRGYTQQSGGSGATTGSGSGGTASSSASAGQNASMQNTGAGAGGGAMAYDGYGHGGGGAAAGGSGASGILIIKGNYALT